MGIGHRLFGDLARYPSLKVRLPNSSTVLITHRPVHPSSLVVVAEPVASNRVLDLVDGDSSLRSALGGMLRQIESLACVPDSDGRVASGIDRVPGERAGTCLCGLGCEAPGARCRVGSGGGIRAKADVELGSREEGCDEWCAVGEGIRVGSDKVVEPIGQPVRRAVMHGPAVRVYRIYRSRDKPYRAGDQIFRTSPVHGGRGGGGVLIVGSVEVTVSGGLVVGGACRLRIGVGGARCLTLRVHTASAVGLLHQA